MTMTPRTLPWLDALSAVVLTTAAVLYFWPVSVTPPASDAVKATDFALPAAALFADSADVSAVVTANLLSSSRRAPSARYVSPELLSGADFIAPSALAASPDTAADDSTDAVPGVYGIVHTDGDWRALVRLTRDDASPVLLREGDRRGVYRVVTIRSNAVVVAGPSGLRTLRLARPARGDSIGKQL